MIKPLDNESLQKACEHLASKHKELAFAFEISGPPPLWDRQPGFSTLLQIILEQQVSLASAKACFDKLSMRLGEVTPQNLLTLDDSELRLAGFSRQKTSYARHLAASIIDESIDLNAVSQMPDADAKAELIKLKGIGEWTSDIYLLMALLRPDVMPRGDIALHAAWQKLSGAEWRPASDEFVELAVRWSPHRSAAARMLWHFYLSEKRRPTA